MPLAEMQKVLIAGERKEEEAILKALQRSGLLELSRPDYGEARPALGDPDDEVMLAELQAAINFLEAASGKKKNLIESLAPYKEPVPEERIESIGRKSDWKEILKRVKEIVSRLGNLKAAEADLTKSLKLLTPWGALKGGLNAQDELGRSTIVFGRVRSSGLEELSIELERGFPALAIEEISRSKDISYVAVACFKEEAKGVSEALGSAGFTLVGLPRTERSAAEEIEKLGSALNSIRLEKEETLKEAVLIAARIKELGYAYDHIAIRKQRADARGNVAASNRMVVAAGWLVKKDLEALQKALSRSPGGGEAVPVEPDEGETVPTVIENPPVFRPFELITKIFGVPGSNEVDPTQALSVFYIFFFAVCLSDAAYGILLALVSYYFLKKLTLSEGGRNLLLLLFWGGILSIFTGIFTGSYFAIDLEALPQSPIRDLAMRLTFVDPIKSPLNVLILSLAIGFFQSMVGLAIGMYWKIKHKDPVTGILDYGLWIFFLSSLVLLLVGYPHGGSMSIAGAALLVVTQGRREKNIFKKGIIGLLSLYRTTAFLGDTLSYSRLLALMMTTGIIGMVVNIIAGLAMESVPVFGYVIMFAILVIGHVFNLVVSVLGAFVHSMRLQLVEFFGKFYEGTGRMFKPFRQETKFVMIKGE